MSNQSMDRPASLKRVPRPAPDDGVDPVDTTPTRSVDEPATQASAAPNPLTPATTPSVASGTRRTAAADAAASARAAAPYPLSTRIAPDVRTVLDGAIAKGNTERAAVEIAIREYWGGRI